MKRTKIAWPCVLLAVIALMLSGCASVPMGHAADDARAKTFAPRADKANIYLYRDELLGFAFAMTVALDGRRAGQTVGQSFIQWEVDPGMHEIASYTEDIATVKLNAEAGKSYYVWQEVKIGFWSAQSMLHEVDETTGRRGVIRCRLAKSGI